MSYHTNVGYLRRLIKDVAHITLAALISAVICLSILSVCTAFVRRHQLSQGQPKPTSEKRLTDAQLEGWYVTYNHDYFNDELPKDTDVTWADLTMLEDMGFTLKKFDGTGLVIMIDRESNPVGRQARMTLLHEMCHVKLYGHELGDHSDDFQRCMQTISLKGAFKNLW